MDFALLPQAAVVGRVTNKISLQHSRRGTAYLPLLIYMYHRGHAKLMPTVAFNKEAHRIADTIQQGDLLKLTVRIDAVRNHKFLNPTLVINDVSFLEPRMMREIYHGKHGKQLKVLFPVMPINYRVRNQTKPKRPQAAKEPAKPRKSSSESNSIQVDVITPSERHQAESSESADNSDATRATSDTASHENASSSSASGDWMDDVLGKTKVPFPGMH